MNKIDWKIICGDALETMAKMPSSSIDLVITSPPYNLGEGMESKGGLRIAHQGSKWSKQTSGVGWSIGYDVCRDDLPYPEYVEWQGKVLKECFRLIRSSGAIYYNHKPRVVNGILRHPISLIGDLPLRQEIIWNRKSGFNATNNAYMPTHEIILIIAKKDFRLRDKSASAIGSVWTFPPDISTDHPAPFPLELPRKILETTTAKTVLDPFCGSSTTGAACVEFGRDFIGIELSEFWADYGKARIRRALGQAVDLPRRIIADKPLPLFEAI